MGIASTDGKIYWAKTDPKGVGPLKTNVTDAGNDLTLI